MKNYSNVKGIRSKIKTSSRNGVTGVVANSSIIPYPANFVVPGSGAGILPDTTMTGSPANQAVIASWYNSMAASAKKSDISLPFYSYNYIMLMYGDAFGFNVANIGNAPMNPFQGKSALDFYTHPQNISVAFVPPAGAFDPAKFLQWVEYNYPAVYNQIHVDISNMDAVQNANVAAANAKQAGIIKSVLSVVGAVAGVGIISAVAGLASKSSSSGVAPSIPAVIAALNPNAVVAPAPAPIATGISPIIIFAVLAVIVFIIYLSTRK